MAYGIGGLNKSRSYTDEFEQLFPGYTEREKVFRDEQRRLTKDLIGSQENTLAQVQAAFAALGEAQKPTKFDRISDAALALAGILDMATGKRAKRALAPEKYQAYREGRKRDKAERAAGVAERLKNQLTLAEYSGDIRSRNLQAMLGLAGQDVADLKDRLSLAMKGAESKADIDYKKAATKDIAGKEPTAEEKEAARKQALAEFDEKVYDQAVKAIGTYDPEKFDSYEDYLGKVDLMYERIFARRNRLINPPKPEKGQPRPSDRDLIDIFNFSDMNQEDFEPAIEAGGRNITPQAGAMRQVGSGIVDLINKVGSMYYPNQR